MNTDIEVARPAQLITLNPTEYVGQVCAPFIARLAAASAAAAATDYNVQTTAGMKTAVERRAAFRTIRTELENERKARKSPLLEIGKLIDSRAKEITAQIEPFEAAHDERIKAEEARKETERAARVAAELARVNGIQSLIAGMRDWVGASAHLDSSGIAVGIETVTAMEVTHEAFAEFSGQAQIAKDETLERLTGLRTAALAREESIAREKAEREAEAARLKAERAEFTRQQAEAAERERVAAAERARIDAEAKAERQRMQDEQDAADARRRAQQMEADRELAAQRAELERGKRELAEAQAKAERERLDREAAERSRKEQEAAAEQRRIDAAAAEEARAAAAVQAEADRIEAAKLQADRDLEAKQRREDYRNTLASAYEHALTKSFKQADLQKLLLSAGIDDSFADPLVLSMADANLSIGPRAEKPKKAA